MLVFGGVRSTSVSTSWLLVFSMFWYYVGFGGESSRISTPMSWNCQIHPLSRPTILKLCMSSRCKHRFLSYAPLRPLNLCGLAHLHGQQKTEVSCGVGPWGIKIHRTKTKQKNGDASHYRTTCRDLPNNIRWLPQKTRCVSKTLIFHDETWRKRFWGNVLLSRWDGPVETLQTCSTQGPSASEAIWFSDPND